jgi:hypothetical protein
MPYNKDELRELFTEIVVEHNRRYNDLNDDHAEQHQWLKERIEAEHDRREMYIAVRNAAIGWSIPFILGGIVIWMNTGHWPSP